MARFANLCCEAKWSFDLETVTPLLIRAGTASGLDPTRPDMEFVRAHVAGEEQPIPFIPGSSLKGVLRARAGRILNTVARDSAAPGAEGGHLEDLFGSTRFRSRVNVADAYPVSSPEGRVFRLGTRTNVRIARDSGAAASGALFVPEVVEHGRFHCELTIVNYRQWHLRLLAWLLADFDEGFLTLGGGTSRGLGRVRVIESMTLLRDYRGDGLADAAGARLGLHAETAAGLWHEGRVQGYRPWIDLPELLPQGSLPTAPLAPVASAHRAPATGSREGAGR